MAVAPRLVGVTAGLNDGFFAMLLCFFRVKHKVLEIFREAKVADKSKTDHAESYNDLAL